MKCFGRDVSSGSVIVLEGDAILTSAEELISPPEETTWLAPGFIDIQVNGFAGADY